MWPGLRRALLNCPSNTLLLNGFIEKGRKEQARENLLELAFLCLLQVPSEWQGEGETLSSERKIFGE